MNKNLSATAYQFFFHKPDYTNQKSMTRDNITIRVYKAVAGFFNIYTFCYRILIKYILARFETTVYTKSSE